MGKGRFKLVIADYINIDIVLYHENNTIYGTLIGHYYNQDYGHFFIFKEGSILNYHGIFSEFLYKVPINNKYDIEEFNCPTIDEMIKW